MSDPILAIVVAVGENGAIGRSGDMPWRMSGDLRRFRQMTMGKPVIMGRKTFESIGRVLDGRTNIVVTNDRSWRVDGVESCHSVDEAVEIARKIAKNDGVEEIMVIGGAQIYAALLPSVRRIYLTRIHVSPDGDTFFLDLEPAAWHEAGREALERHAKDDHASTLIILERSKND